MCRAGFAPVLMERLTRSTLLWKALGHPLMVLGLTMWVAEAQPVIFQAGMANAASGYVEYERDVMAAEISQGALFAIVGRDLGPGEGQWSADTRTELAGTSVSVSVGALRRSAAMVYTSARLVAGIFPPDLPPGDGSFSVTYGGQTSAPARVRVLRRAFGIFTQNLGPGPAVAQNVGPEGDHRLNTFTDAARPGQRIVLWGTGLGPSRSQQAGRPPRSRPSDDPNAGMEVLVGTKAARVLHAGPSECCPGIDHVVFETPAGIEGCSVPIAVKFGDGDMSRNFATMSIAAGAGTCSDPHHLSASEVERAQAGEAVSQGSVLLIGSPGRLVELTGRFFRAPPSFYATSFGAPPPFGSCVVDRSSLPRISFPFLPLPSRATRTPGPGLFLDAGRSLNLQGPRGTTTQVPQGAPGYYRYPPPSMPPVPPPWEGGDNTIDNGAGGRDVGSFQALITLPRDPYRAEVVRSPEGITVTWTGGDPTGEYVTIFGGLEYYGEEFVSGASWFVCTERADRGSSTVPAAILQAVTRGLAREHRGFLGVTVTAQSLPGRFRSQAPGVNHIELAYQAWLFGTNLDLR